MVQLVRVHAGNPAGSARARPRRFALAWGARPSTPRPAHVLSDEQILALVAAAERLSQRQRNRYPDISTEEADEVLLCVDLAVRSGRLVLAERAARGLTRPGRPLPGLRSRGVACDEPSGTGAAASDS